MELLTAKAIETALQTLQGWELYGKEIKKTYKLKHFQEAITFVNQVADLAEKADHHPDILIHGWNKVTLSLSTHCMGGLTRKDMDLAAATNRIVL